MDTFDVTKVESALGANRALQTTIQAELRRIREAKALNRLKAASMVDLITQKGPLDCLRSFSNIATNASEAPKWCPRFFEDSSGSRARSLYEDDDNSEFFRRVRPPWQTKESKELVKTVKSAISANFPLNDRFQRVAAVLKTPQHGIRRTPDECKVEYDRQCEKPLTKDEKKRLDAIVNNSNDEVDWFTVAETLSVDRTIRCSPFQCFVASKKLEQAGKKRKQIATWTPEEDILLLKFMLAAGPQLMLDYRHPFFRWTLPKELFPNKTGKQVFDRINVSSLNPKLADGEWSDFEERKLTVLIKIYGGDLLLASKHMNRTPKAVLDKWQRTLNPEHITGPFSQEEDEKLVSIIRSHPNLGWRDISRAHFPDRHPQRLMNRWSDLATDQDIIAREQNTRKRSKQMKTKRF